MKPMLAENWDETKVKFPLIVQPKIDGVRGVNFTGRLTGRSLKEFKNAHAVKLYSSIEYIGLDGELVVGPTWTDPALCRNTTSAVNTIEGTPDIHWVVFDYVKYDAVMRPYTERYEYLQRVVDSLPDHVHVMPSFPVNTMEELLMYDQQFLDSGYEGTIIRDPQGRYKQGRCTVRSAELLRIKRFIEEEAVVEAIIEGRSNGNEAVINELGYTERSTHQDNMVPNGMVGALQCRDWKTGSNITVAAGSMPHADRVRYFENPKLIVGQVIKYKTFPKGVKDKPRFPTFQCIRVKEDM